MVPIAQSSTRMRCSSSERNSRTRALPSFSTVRSRTIEPFYSALSLPSGRQADGFQHVAGQMGGARGRHDVGAADERLSLSQDTLGHLGAVPGGVFGRERSQLLPYAFRDVYARDLVVEKLGLAGAPEGHETEQDTNLPFPDLLERPVEHPDLEDRLGPERVGASLDLAPELLYLALEVLRGRVERCPDKEAGRLPDGVAGQVLASVHTREDVYEADRVGVEDARGLGVVPDLGRVARHGEDVPDAEGGGAEQVGLQAYEVPVASLDVGDGLDSGLVLHDPGRDHRVHAQAGAGPVRDVYGVHAALLQAPGRVDY